jgi:hypothetical protein
MKTAVAMCNRRKEEAREKACMTRVRKQAIHFDRRGGVLFYQGASGKTVDHIRLSQADHTIFVVVAFTDRTEWSVTLNSIPVAAVSLYAPGDGDLGDLEPIAESGHILLPETGHIQWDQIKQPPKQRKTRKRVA